MKSPAVKAFCTVMTSPSQDLMGMPSLLHARPPQNGGSKQYNHRQMSTMSTPQKNDALRNIILQNSIYLRGMTLLRKGCAWSDVQPEWSGRMESMLQCLHLRWWVSCARMSTARSSVRWFRKCLCAHLPRRPASCQACQALSAVTKSPSPTANLCASTPQASVQENEVSQSSDAKGTGLSDMARFSQTHPWLVTVDVGMRYAYVHLIGVSTAHLALAASRALRWPWGLSQMLCTLSSATIVSTSSEQPRSPDASRAYPSLGSSGSSARCCPSGSVNLLMPQAFGAHPRPHAHSLSCLQPCWPSRCSGTLQHLCGRSCSQQTAAAG